MHSGQKPEDTFIAQDVVLVRLDDFFLSLRALARAGNLSVKTLRGYLTDSTHPLPHYRPGGKVIIRWSDFLRWLEHYKVMKSADLDRMVEEVMVYLRGSKPCSARVRNRRRSRHEVKSSKD